MLYSCCLMSSIGGRQECWMWLKRGGRSEVASPATITNSLSVQVPVCGNIASFVYLVIVYMRQSASMAPGQRAAVCELCRVGITLLSIQVSGVSVSKVKTTLQ